MKKIVLIGRSESGKTTLTQALRGETISYHKTQYVNHFDAVIDTPGEYAQVGHLGAALALYAYEADVVGLLLAATESYSLFPPNVAGMTNRDTVGIITKIDAENADINRAKLWLQLAGCKKIFCVNTIKRQGIAEIIDYLKEEEDFCRGSEKVHE